MAVSLSVEEVHTFLSLIAEERRMKKPFFVYSFLHFVYLPLYLCTFVSVFCFNKNNLIEYEYL